MSAKKEMPRARTSTKRNRSRRKTRSKPYSKPHLKPHSKSHLKPHSKSHLKPHSKSQSQKRWKKRIISFRTFGTSYAFQQEIMHLLNQISDEYDELEDNMSTGRNIIRAFGFTLMRLKNKRTPALHNMKKSGKLLLDRVKYIFQKKLTIDATLSGLMNMNGKNITEFWKIDLADSKDPWVHINIETNDDAKQEIMYRDLLDSVKQDIINCNLAYSQAMEDMSNSVGESIMNHIIADSAQQPLLKGSELDRFYKDTVPRMMGYFL
jgi:hypothetical protein